MPSDKKDAIREAHADFSRDLEDAMLTLGATDVIGIMRNPEGDLHMFGTPHWEPKEVLRTLLAAHRTFRDAFSNE